MAIKNIIFDIGQVLVDFRWEQHMRDLGFSDDAITAVGDGWVKAPIWNELDRGILSEEECLALAYNAVPDYKAEIDLFWGNPDGMIRCRTQSAPWLCSLKERGYGIFLLSNYPRSLFEAHKKEFAPFLPYVDGRVVSGFEGVMKPDRGIYELLLERYGFKAEECVFIDDRSENIEGAEAVGIKGLLLTDPEAAIAELDKLLDENK